MDVSAVMERGAAALTLPGAGPALVVTLRTIPVQFDAGAADSAEDAAFHNFTRQNHPPRISRPALGVKLDSRLPNGCCHGVGLGYAARHRPLREDMAPRFSGGDRRLLPNRGRGEEHHRLHVAIFQQLFMGTILPNLGLGSGFRRLNQLLPTLAFFRRARPPKASFARGRLPWHTPHGAWFASSQPVHSTKSATATTCAMSARLA